MDSKGKTWTDLSDSTNDELENIIMPRSHEIGDAMLCLLNFFDNIITMALLYASEKKMFEGLLAKNGLFYMQGAQ
jgi:hypothetical protein